MRHVGRHVSRVKTLNTELMRLNQSRDSSSSLATLIRHIDSKKQVDVSSITYGITAAARLGAFAPALKLWSTMLSLRLKPTVYTYSSMLYACKTARSWKVGRKLYNEMTSRDIISYNSMLGLCLVCGKHIDAYQVFNDMLTEGVLPNTLTFTTLFDLCRSSSDFTAAIKYFKIMDELDVKCSAYGYTALINLCDKASRFDQALYLHEHMVDNHVTPSVFVYSSLISAASHDYRKALYFFNEMVSSGIKPNLVSCTALLNACVRSNKITEGFKLFSFMQKAGFEIDFVAKYALMHLYVAAGHFSQADSVFMSMDIPSTASYDLALLICYKTRNIARSISLYEEMRFNGTPLSNVTYDMLLRTSRACGNSSSTVFSLFEDMLVLNIIPSVSNFNTLLSTCLALRHFNSAHFVFEELLASDAVPNSTSFLLFLTSIAVSHRSDLSEFYLNLMFKVLPNVNSNVVDVGLLAFPRKCRFKMAVHLLEGWVASDSLSECQAHNILITLLFQLGRYHDLLSVYQDMTLESVALDLPTTTRVIKALTDTGYNSHAIDLFSEVSSKDIAIYNAALRSCQIARKPNLALRIFTEIANDTKVKRNIVSYATLVSTLCNVECPEIPRTLRILEEMSSRGIAPNIQVYSSVITGCSKLMVPLTAQYMFAEVGFPDISLMNSMLGVYTRGLSTIISLRFAEEFFHVDRFTYHNLMQMYGRLNNSEMVMYLLHDMDTVGIEPNSFTHSIILNCLDRWGQVSCMEKYFASIQPE